MRHLICGSFASKAMGSCTLECVGYAVAVVSAFLAVPTGLFGLGAAFVGLGIATEAVYRCLEANGMENCVD